MHRKGYTPKPANVDFSVRFLPRTSAYILSPHRTNTDVSEKTPHKGFEPLTTRLRRPLLYPLS